jgi:TRAP-type mannitol/chloroaromatic compound transport system permease small subunit
MNLFLKLSAAIDGLNRFIGRHAIWLILISVFISAINAVVRKAFSMSSNAYLEIQWYLFAGTFLLMAAYTLLNGEHVKIDVVYGRWSKRTQMWIDVFGFIFFLLPFAGVTLFFSVPFFWQGFISGEMSSNAGGLIRWPVYLLMPVGFFLLFIQGLSELIKRIAFLRGLIEDPTVKAGEKSAEAELAAAIQRLAEEKAASSKA